MYGMKREKYHFAVLIGGCVCTHIHTYIYLSIYTLLIHQYFPRTVLFCSESYCPRRDKSC